MRRRLECLVTPSETLETPGFHISKPFRSGTQNVERLVSDEWRNNNNNKTADKTWVNYGFKSNMFIYYVTT